MPVLTWSAPGSPLLPCSPTAPQSRSLLAAYPTAGFKNATGTDTDQPGTYAPTTRKEQILIAKLLNRGVDPGSRKGGSRMNREGGGDQTQNSFA